MMDDLIDRLAAFEVTAPVDLERIGDAATRRTRRRRVGAATTALAAIAVALAFGAVPTRDSSAPFVGSESPSGEARDEEAVAESQEQADLLAEELLALEYAEFALRFREGAMQDLRITRAADLAEGLRRGLVLRPVDAELGAPGVAVLYGHRTTYGSPFFDLDLLRVGDLLDVESPTVGMIQYEVTAIEHAGADADATELSGLVDEPGEGSWLLLATQDPKWTRDGWLVVVLRALE